MKRPNVDICLATNGKGSVKIDGEDFPVTAISVNAAINEATTVTMTFYASVNYVDAEDTE